MTTDSTVDTYVATSDVLATHLDYLDAKGAAGIAAYFAENGITGYRMRACECPVARYLTRETGAAVVSVGTRWTHAPKFAQDVPTPSQVSFVPTPSNVADFVFAFDTGQYPELEANS